MQACLLGSIALPPVAKYVGQYGCVKGEDFLGSDAGVVVRAVVSFVGAVLMVFRAVLTMLAVVAMDMVFVSLLLLAWIILLVFALVSRIAVPRPLLLLILSSVLLMAALVVAPICTSIRPRVARVMTTSAAPRRI